ncbi:MAG: TlyA family RNA methyltransferase [Clostridia bacterium]|nr:TlyA family RNA methyltransferase [Clostridia bacterium]
MRKRLDEFLVELGLLENITVARAEIMSGRVFVNGVRSDKAGNLVKDDAKIELKTKCPYVSRGGYKIAGAIDGFSLDVTDKNCLDIGSSTGGFTDCLLQRGAKSVCAVDVGVELAWKLRCDERVRVMEKTNIRHCNKDTFGCEFDFICGDVSFISLKHVFPVAEEVLSDAGECVFLVKPQFEAKREDVGQGGIVRDFSVHLEVLKRVVGYTSLVCIGVLPSPIKGGEGNIEYLIRLKRSGTAIEESEFEKAVDYAREKFQKN